MDMNHVLGPLLGAGSMEMNETQILISKVLISSWTVCDEGAKSDINKYRSW